MTISQCWFCNALFLVDVDDPNPLCVSCGLGPRPAALQARAGAGPVPPDGAEAVSAQSLQLVPPLDAAAPVSEPAPVVHPPLGAAITSLEAPNDDDIDATVLHTLAAQPTWVLEFDHGLRLPLVGDNVLIGRRPQSEVGDVATLLVVPDLGKVLSRTHARLRRDPVADTWTIEDLDSANGVSLVRDTGLAVDVAPRRPVPATDRMMLGTLVVRLQRHGDIQRGDLVSTNERS